MKNEAQWKPTKFAYSGNRMRISRTIRFSSRVMVGLIAEQYNENIPKYCKGELLDLGCGKVPMYKAYKPYVEQIECIDWGSSPHENIHLDRQMDLNQALDIEDDRYDTVILSDVLEHIARPQQLLNEIHRILRPGGHLLMNVPFYYFLHEKPHDYHRYTRYALEFMGKESKFELLKVNALGGALEILSDISAKIAYGIPLVGKWIAYVIYKLTWLFNRTGVGQKISRKTGDSFPFGYFAVFRK